MKSYFFNGYKIIINHDYKNLELKNEEYYINIRIIKNGWTCLEKNKFLNSKITWKNAFKKYNIIIKEVTENIIHQQIIAIYLDLIY